MVMSNPVKDLFVATGYATETTAKTFKDTASAGEIAVIASHGKTAPTSGEDFKILAKNASGDLRWSDNIVNAKVVKYTTAVPTLVTPVPAYANFTVSVTGMAVGDLYNGLIRIFNFGSRSVLDQYQVKFDHTFATGDTYDTVTQGLIESLSYNTSKVEGHQGTYVNNKTGYASIWATEAAVVAGKATLTDTELIWVLSNGKPYTVSDKTGATFADICTEKTSWTTEIAAETAEYLPSNPWFDFVKIDGTSPKIYIIAKEQSGNNEKRFPYDIDFEAGLEKIDVSADTGTSVTVTNTGRVSSKGEGKWVRALETMAQGHTGDFYNGMGYPSNFDHTYDASASTNYYMIDIEYEFEPNTISHGDKKYKLIQIACSTSATATSLVSALTTAMS